MKLIPELPVEMCVGKRLQDITIQPLQPYSSEAANFLAALSLRLLASRDIRTYPDVAAFAYWCRKSNLARLSRAFGDSEYRLGRGLVFHVAPSNVPVNFAFSFAFGLLSGNSNIVRLPSAQHPQVEIICSEIRRLFEMPEHCRIAAMNRLIKYPRNEEVTAALSNICHARMLWGGDRTIALMRAMPTSPRCVDIAFADRYSLCVLRSQAILEAGDQKLSELAVGFYNDIFFLDQNACSSPHLIVWQGLPETVDAAKRRFWAAVQNILHAKTPLAPIHALDKYVHLCRTAVALPECRDASWENNRIHRLCLSELPVAIEDYRGRHGFFFEYTASRLSDLKNIVNERYQTVTCYGVDREDVIRVIIQEGLTGIDRVVPVGKALDMSTVWDGYDLIRSLSRIISEV